MLQTCRSSRPRLPLRFTPSFLRLGSWNVVMFVTYEQIKRGMTRAQQYWESPF